MKQMSLDEFYQEFPTSDSAIRYFEKVRFGGIPTDCIKCGAIERVRVKTIGFYRCLDCKGTFSIRTGTMLEDTRLPLNKWLLAMYSFTLSRKGISSIQLGKLLGITQKSAWFLLQRLRYSCSSEFKTLLNGIVEVDEAFIGGKQKGVVGKSKDMGNRYVVVVMDRETDEILISHITSYKKFKNDYEKNKARLMNNE
ncbi:MAG: IS1595 family transposase [Micrococcaceae bacterium]